MPRRFDGTSPGFEQELRAFLAEKREESADVGQTVADIIADVRRRGDAALCDYTTRFDRFSLSPDIIRLSEAEIAAAAASCPKEVRNALALAASRIRRYHEKQMPRDERYTDDEGITLGWRWQGIDSVGLYVPGGTAAYPSSVLMNAVPAQVAGVRRLVMVVPTPDNAMNPAVFAAAQEAGITEIYRIGGAQAIAALAYGTETIRPVAKIVGPGNAWVAEAKRQVFGIVGIDMIAGPSDITVVADSGSNPRWIAADLLSQAEHDLLARAVLITDDAAYANAVEQAVESHLSSLPRAEIARQSWEKHGVIVVADSLVSAAMAVNIVAPEHLELAVADPEALLPHIRQAGAIFLGRHTPEAIGDYLAGPSHVLPTEGTAAFASGLSVYDFLTRSSIIGCSQDALHKLGWETVRLAEAEGLEAHALSVRIRLQANCDG